MNTRQISLATGLVTLISTATVPGVALAGSLEAEHELAVYSLSQYEYGWKSTIVPLYTTMDPYYGFWEQLYNCSTSECANTYSARFQNSQVTVNQMATTAALQTNRGWSGSDMVVFYGHTTMIQPQWVDWFELWRYGQYGWEHATISDWRTWGTAAEPYWYHRASPITDASLYNAYAVFYGYNRYTSILPGKDFPVYGNWETENTWSQYVGDTRTHHLAGELSGSSETDATPLPRPIEMGMPWP